MAMVKAFAYGAGPSEIAALLEYHRVVIWQLHMPMKVLNLEMQVFHYPSWL